MLQPHGSLTCLCAAEGGDQKYVTGIYAGCVLTKRCFELQGVRADNAAIAMDQPPVSGYNVKTTMRAVLRALRHLHTLRGFEMSSATWTGLRYYVFNILNKKVRFVVMTASVQGSSCVVRHALLSQVLVTFG